MSSAADVWRDSRRGGGGEVRALGGVIKKVDRPNCFGRDVGP